MSTVRPDTAERDVDCGPSLLRQFCWACASGPFAGWFLAMLTQGRWVDAAGVACAAYAAWSLWMIAVKAARAVRPWR